MASSTYTINTIESGRFQHTLICSACRNRSTRETMDRSEWTDASAIAVMNPLRTRKTASDSGYRADRRPEPSFVRMI